MYGSWHHRYPIRPWLRLRSPLSAVRAVRRDRGPRDTHLHRRRRLLVREPLLAARQAIVPFGRAAAARATAATAGGAATAGAEAFWVREGWREPVPARRSAGVGKEKAGRRIRTSVAPGTAASDTDVAWRGRRIFSELEG
jgi:hypothetical protein